MITCLQYWVLLILIHHLIQKKIRIFQMPVNFCGKESAKPTEMIFKTDVPFPTAISECSPGSTVRLNHHSSDDRNTEKAGSKPYNCPVCCKGFCKPNLLSKYKVIYPHYKPYKCQEYGMAFVQLVWFKRHRQTHCGGRPFYCVEHGGTFTRLESRQGHQGSHTGEKPHSCASCGRSFTESGALRRHDGLIEQRNPSGWDSYHHLLILFPLRSNIAGFLI